MRSLIERILHIPRASQVKVAQAFSFAFGTAAAYLATRSVADSVFLSRVGIDRLPEMYVLSAGTVALTTLFYSRWLRQASFLRVIQAILILEAILSVALALLLEARLSHLATAAAVYLLAEVRGTFGVIHLSTMVNEEFRGDDPKWTFGVVNAGATLAGVLGGGFISVFALRLGTANLLYLVAVLDLVSLVPVRRFSKLHRRQERRLPASAVVSSRPKQSLREIANLRFTRVVCAVVVLKVAVVTFVGFQWKVLAAENFLPAEDSLTRFFGATYAVIFLITGLIQLLVAGRFFRTFGLLAGLTVFPIMLAIANIGILATTAPALMLAVSTLARGCDVFRRGIEDPSTQIVYGPLPTGTRRLTIALVVGIAKPVAEALAAVLLLSLMAFLSVQDLSYAVLLCIVPWLIATTVCYREYVRRSADSRPDTEAPPVAIQSIEVD